jgi:hypothetical protein
MSRWTAILAVACGLSVFAGLAQAQALEAKASFVFNGRQVTIDKNNGEAARFAATFATPGNTCGVTCIAPMQAAQGVPTVGETEVLGFLEEQVAGGTGLLVDARMPQDRARGFIPGSVNLPYATMTGASGYRDEILEALGAQSLDGFYAFTDAQHLMVFDTGPSTDDAGTLIAQLIASGYPREKIRYYRGGMQVWSVLGFSIEEGS